MNTGHILLCCILLQALAYTRSMDGNQDLGSLGSPDSDLDKPLQATMEQRFKNMEMTVRRFEAAFDGLTKVISMKKVDIQSRVRVLEKKVAQLSKTPWMMKRFTYEFPTLTKSPLSAANSNSYRIPAALLPKNAKAVIVAIKCSSWKERGLSPTMSITLQQKGNTDAGKTTLDAPMNDFYYEVLMPWDGSYGNTIDIMVNGNSPNIYSIRLVGYIA
ncbi:uncharacterized protein LOC135688696 [Rhopilema esculentum]|uniref:uncharacterized protein LOC135688696 n=1 Tax=Rhopilema esculentum TaxID=499914 RepID=UPI0031D801EB|eukprot:gene7684-13507_t